MKEKPPEFCQISGDWGELGILDLAWMSLRKFYWTLQSAVVIAFVVSELLRENQQDRKLPPSPPSLTLGLILPIRNLNSDEDIFTQKE